MSYPRPSAQLVLGILLAILTVGSLDTPVAAATTPPPTCTGWSDQLHPPTSIKVLRSKGPYTGHVQTVPFWDYVAVVVRAEYSTGADKPPLWMRTAAITVKQYGWFFTIVWRGGTATWTNADGSTSTGCYDVRDTTADQIYKPQETAPDGTIFPGNVPTVPIYRAMHETWHITLRKWNAKKSVTRFFETGYRSGKKVPCGADATGFKIFQKSLRDCVNKSLTMSEVLRTYFQPGFIVNTREHDILADGGAWRGDVGYLSPGSGTTTQWRLYPGGNDSFGQATTGTFDVDYSSLVGYGVGNVDASGDGSGPADASQFADLVMVTNDWRVLVAHATGGGFSTSLVSTAFTGGASRVVVGDFNGDLLADVGLVSSTAGDATLRVMTAKGDGTFNDPATRWSGPLSLSSDVFVAAGDVNGDGKADLVVRDSAGNYLSALSPASCSDLSTWGPCPVDAAGIPALGPLNAAFSAGQVASSAKPVIGDFDRDGLADVILVAADGSQIMALPGRTNGTFSAPQTLWTGSGATGQPVAMNVNGDGMTDLVQVRPGGLAWFRTNERTISPASMTPMTTFSDSALGTSGGSPF